MSTYGSSLKKSGRRRMALTCLRGVMSVLAIGCVSPAFSQQTLDPTKPAADAAQPFRFFISGHSLTDNPLPQYIAAIASGQGLQVYWNQQIGIGAPISWRTRGDINKPPDWNGYRMGKNNGTQNMDIVAELRRKVAPAKYNTLIVAEGHHTAMVLRWNDTVRYLRHYHELLIEGNPDGTTYLYEPWEGIRDLSNPSPWIKLEREATKAWGCVVTRINLSLEHEGRADRVKSLPIASGLVHLVEKATNQKVGGISASSSQETLKRIFIDDVHPTRLGLYYIALLNYISVSGRTPDRPWRPDFVSEEQAKNLLEIALSFNEERNATYRPLSMQECSRHMADTFCEAWNSYVPGGKWGAIRVNDCVPFFSQQTAERGRFDVENPFVFDQTVDKKYWFPPP